MNRINGKGNYILGIVGAVLMNVLFWGTVIYMNRTQLGFEACFCATILEQIVGYYFVCLWSQDKRKCGNVLLVSMLIISLVVTYIVYRINEWFILFFIMYIVICFVILWIHIIRCISIRERLDKKNCR